MCGGGKRGKTTTMVGFGGAWSGARRLGRREKASERGARERAKKRKREIENVDEGRPRVAHWSGSGELRVEWRGRQASEMEAGGTSISAGTGAPEPWTDGAVLANVQPTPSSTTGLTHAETGKPLSRVHDAVARRLRGLNTTP